MNNTVKALNFTRDAIANGGNHGILNISKGGRGLFYGADDRLEIKLQEKGPLKP